LEIYWAPVLEPFPAVDVAPAGNWALIGTSGSTNYTEDGVSLAFDKSFEVFRGLGNTYPLKSFLTETDGFVRVSIADMTLAQLRMAFNLNTVTSDVGPPAIDSFSLDVGSTLTEMALLVRGAGKSPEFDGSNMQFELNRVVETGSHEIIFVKGDAASVELEFRILLDATDAVGRLVAATA